MEIESKSTSIWQKDLIIGSKIWVATSDHNLALIHQQVIITAENGNPETVAAQMTVFSRILWCRSRRTWRWGGHTSPWWRPRWCSSCCMFCCYTGGASGMYRLATCCTPPYSPSLKIKDWIKLTINSYNLLISLPPRKNQIACKQLTLFFSWKQLILFYDIDM
jgi:hypothetical protein